MLSKTVFDHPAQIYAEKMLMAPKSIWIDFFRHLFEFLPLLGLFHGLGLPLIDELLRVVLILLPGHRRVPSVIGMHEEENNGHVVFK